jgi:hypothetical protein
MDVDLLKAHAEKGCVDCNAWIDHDPRWGPNGRVYHDDTCPYYLQLVEDQTEWDE